MTTQNTSEQQRFLKQQAALRENLKKRKEQQRLRVPQSTPTPQKEIKEEHNDRTQ
jgi:hypothetical protein